MSNDSVFAWESSPSRSLLASAIGVAVATALPLSQVDAAESAAPQRQLGKISVSADEEEVGYKSDTAESPKYTAPLLDTPRSVTVITQDVLRSTASTSLVEALRTTPGITLGAGEGGNPVGDRPFLRGFDTQSSTYVDGMRDIGAQSREVFNLESVEVAKGPGGTYDGRGAAGGTLNLVSKTPRKGDFLAGTLGAGTDDYKRATVDGNLAFGESSAFRLNALYHDADVAGRDEVYNKRWGVAPSLAFGLDGDTTATLSYYHLQSDNLPDTGIPYSNPAFRARPDAPARVLGTGDGSPLDVDMDTFYGLTGRDFYKDRSDIATVRIEHKLSDALRIRNSTRYSQTRQDYIWTQPDDSKGNIYYGQLWRRINSRVTTVDTIANQTDLFGEFVTGKLRHSFSAGIELSKEEGENDNYAVATGSGDILTGTPAVPNPNWSCGANVGAAGGYNCTDLFNPNPHDPWNGTITRNNNPTNLQTTTRSAYVFDTIEFSPQWLLNLGARLDDYSTESISAINRTVGNPAYGTRTTLERDDNLFNYQAGLVFKPLENGSIYVSYATSSTPLNATLAQGSESQSLTVATQDLSPEKNRSIELGTKWDLLDARLSLTGALFRTETTNARITVADGTARMAGEKRIQGVELGFAGNITSAWQVFGGYTFLDSELVSAGGSGANFGLANGDSFPNTPKNSASLWTTYRVLPKLVVGGGAFYMDKVWGSELNNKWVPSYVRIDATATYEFGPAYSLQINVQNLTDERYFDKAYPTHYANVAPGRSATATLNVRF